MDAGLRSRRGKIRRLVQLIDEHPEAFAYDWRTRFGLPLAALFDGRMSWDEAYDLATVLASDPTSRVGVAVSGLAYPWSTEAGILADLYDVTTQANTNPKRKSSWRPRPRPYETDSKEVSRSAKPTLTQDRIRAALAAVGH